MSKTIEVKGTFDRIALANLHKKSPLQPGDILISRKNEKFTVTKVYPVKRYLAGKSWDDGEAFDITGSKKGKVFTIYVR